MGNMIEIRWHGRGGQGTVTAAKMLADALLIYPYTAWEIPYIHSSL